MPKVKQQARKNINFRETRSERSANISYANFGHYIKKIGRFVNIKKK